MSGSSISEEFDVLKAIYDDDIKVLDFFSSPDDKCEVPLKLPFILEVKINDVCSVLFYLPESYPSDKPDVKVKASSMNSLLLEEKIKKLFTEKDDNYLYDAIELARTWFSDSTLSGSDSVAEGKGSETICKFFKEGKCRFGENCFNKHPVQTGSLEPNDATLKMKSHSGKKDGIRNGPIPEKSPAIGESSVVANKKQSMKTATDVISRIQWDEDLPTENFIVGYLDRFIGIVEKSFNSFSWEDIASVDYSTLAIPKHRIQYFKYKDTIVWDKRSRLDKVFGSTGDSKEIYKIIQDYERKLDEVTEDSKTKRDTDSGPGNFDDDDGNDSSSSGYDSDDNSAKQVEVKQKLYSQRDRPNFFFCFKVTNSQIRKKILDIQEEIVSCDNLLKEGCLKETEFHVTLCMLRLNSDEEKEKAVAVLETMQQILVCMLPTSRTLNLQKLGNFRGRILHVEVQPDPVLSKFVSILLLKLKDAGLNPCGNRESYCPHVTILKLSRSMCRSIPSKMIDSNYYQHHVHDRFGSQAVEKVYLCSTSKQRNQEGFYCDIGSKTNSLLYLSDKLPNAVARHVNQLAKESVLTESESDELLQALLSEDEAQFEIAVCRYEELLAQRSFHPKGSHTVFIMRGLQGSGKSYFARRCAENTQKVTGANSWVICSADEYFERNGREYGFSPSELADAHMFCRKSFINALNTDTQFIIVDNTNSKTWEYLIYERIAKICGYLTHVIEIACKDEETVAKFIERCRHKVDREAVHRLWNQWEADNRANVIEPLFGDKISDITLFDVVKSNEESKVTVKEVLFSGLFLDNESKARLLNEYPSLHSKCTGNHLTYCYKPMREELRYIDVGKTASVSVVGYVCNDFIQAVAVKEIGEVYCKIEVPHITISHSKKAAPQHAKLALQNKSIWQTPEKEIVLTGQIGVQVSVGRKNSVCITDPQLFKKACNQIDNAKHSSDMMEDLRGKVSEAKTKIQLNKDDVESLYVFDFDGTLFNTPDPVIGRKQYREAKGERWPHKGWIGQPESLQWPLQTKPGPSFVDFKEHLGRAGSLTVMLTGRLQRTVAGVNEVLREFGIHPECCYLKPDDENEVSRNMAKVHSFKKDVIRRLLKEHPKVKVAKLWDDRQDNIDAFKSLRREYKDVDFELFKVDSKQSPDGEKSPPHLKGNSDEFNDNLLQMIDDFGFGCPPSFDAAVKEGIDFIEDVWLHCLGLTKDKASQTVHQFGSYPLRRSGDVDLCLFAPASLRSDECIFKLEAELSKRGVKHLHTATGIRCPRLKLRLHFSNTAPVDFDIVFAACLPVENEVHYDLREIYENGDIAMKSAIEGLLFLERVKNCIESKLSIEQFGKLVDLLVYYLKTKHLKGNAFHCLRTFHLVRALAEMFSKTKESFQSMGDLVRKSFEHLATLDAQYWQRICKEFVPEEIIQQLSESFVSGYELINQSKSCAALYARVQFPPEGHEVVSVTVKSHIKDLQWRASVLIEAKLGTCIRRLLSSGINVIPGPSDYDGKILFAIPANETSFRVSQNALENLKSETIFLANKSDLSLKVQIGNIV